MLSPIIHLTTNMSNDYDETSKQANGLALMTILPMTMKKETMEKWVLQRRRKSKELSQYTITDRVNVSFWTEGRVA
jgi:hypothetical protein